MNWKEWTYKGRKLAPLHIMVWKLFWFVFYLAALVVTCVFAALGFGVDAAVELWEQGK
jgi:hypothetical protein